MLAASSLRLPLASLASLAAALVLAACGGAAPAADHPKSDAPAVDGGASIDADAAAPEPHAIRLDDLGMSFALPDGYRVVGDSELSARIRSSTDLKLRALIRERSEERRGIPLLTLAKEGAGGGLTINVTLTVVAVPEDARASELLEQQRGVMEAYLPDFAVTGAPAESVVDGVTGAELSARYTLKSRSGAKRVASRLRLFPRDGVAVVATAVWPDGDEAMAEEARLVLEGLHFYAPVR